jgi:type I restriction enzyme, S subunit
MSWKKVRLGDILRRRKEFISVNPDEEYKLVTIRIHHKGVVQRCLMKGSEIKSPMSVVRAGDFILSGIDARNGAFGIVPNELEGAIVTNDFWSLDSDDTKIEKEFLLFLTSTDFFDYICKQSSEGVTQRVRLQKDKFFNEISLPPIAEQKLILEKLQKQKSISEILKAELAHQRTLVKNLRQQLLQDAVQGKLVKNGVYTEGSLSAHDLLKQIKKEKAQLIKDKKLKKEKELPPIKAEEIPFEIPENWAWCRLGEIAFDISTGPFGTMLHKSDYVENGIPLINPMNMVNGKIVASTKMMVSEETKQKLKSYVLQTGDIVIGRRGEMGRCAVVTENENGWLCGTGSFFLQLHPSISREYFIRMLSSNFAKSLLLGSSVGSTMDNLNHRILINFPIPLPPLETQHQIVSKIDSLMQVCAALDASIELSARTNEALLQQVLREALGNG